MLTVSFVISILIQVGLPIALGFIIIRRYNVEWKVLGIGVLAYSPLACGLLSGHALNPPKGSRLGPNSGAEHFRGKLEPFAELCRAMGHADADVALGWVLAQPAMASVIIGPRTAEQVTAAVECLKVKFDEASVKRINEIFPGPGGQAPEAYAW